MQRQNLYQTLQVDPEAEPDVIAAAYRVLAAKLHPDKDISGVAEVRMRELNRAYSVLRDPNQRREYDATLANVELAPVGPGHPHDNPGPLASRVNARDAGAAGQVRLDFGRYAGWTLEELARADPDYLRWLSRHSSGIRYRGPILRLLASHEDSRSTLRASR